MKLEQRHIKKIDPLLQNALKQAGGDEQLCVIMVLGSESRDTGDNYIYQQLNPSEFPSRQNYREALIKQRQAQLDREIGDTLSALQNLSLFVRDRTISHSVVVKGAARQILESLELPGVRYASLDRPLELIKP
jgi:hypothetical protein